MKVLQPCPHKFGELRKYLRIPLPIAIDALIREAQYIVDNYRIVGLVPSKVNTLRRALIQIKLAKKQTR